MANCQDPDVNRVISSEASSGIDPTDHEVGQYNIACLSHGAVTMEEMCDKFELLGCKSAEEREIQSLYDFELGKPFLYFATSMWPTKRRAWA